MAYEYTRVNWDTINTPLSPMNLNNMDEGIEMAFKEILALDKSSKQYSDTNILSFRFSFSIDEEVSKYKYFKLPENIDYNKYVALGIFSRNGKAQIMVYDVECAFDSAQWDNLSLKINTIDNKLELHSTYSTFGTFNILLIPAAETTVLEEISN